MVSPIQRSFAGGELAPALYARADQSKYAQGLKTCRNFIIQRHGGAANRPGTRFVAEAKGACRLIKFVFNSDQTYVIELGDGYMRFIRNGGQLVVSSVDAWVTGTVYAEADLVENNGTKYYCTAAHTASSSNEPGFGADWKWVWHALSGNVYEIPAPYPLADIDGVQFVQSGDVVTMTHPSYPVQLLARTGHTSWTLNNLSTTPDIAAPANVAVTAGNTGSIDFRYKVTAIQAETFQESEGSVEATVTGGVPSATSPNTITWDAVSGATEYNVFKDFNGVLGYIGVAVGTSFEDTNIEADVAQVPPDPQTPFSGTGNYPAAVNYFQQRLLFGRTDNNPEKVWASRSADFYNFSRRRPLQEDDAFNFTIAGRQVNEVRHFLDLGALVVFTSGAEYIVQGDADGIIRSGYHWPRAQGYNGASRLQPITIGNTALYIQARGSIIRDLVYTQESEGYAGNDLTIFSSHLVDGHQLISWDYQQIPHSLVWVVRDDGVLLSLTYVKEHKVWGWARHDTDGLYQSVTCIPEGTKDVAYFLVKRTINGVTRYFIEYLEDRQIDGILDAFFVDSGLTYDGRNSDATHTMKLSGGVDWTYDEVLTLTSSASFFETWDVGNAIVIHYSAVDEDGETVVRQLTATITEYTSATEVSVQTDKTVPESLRDVAAASWARAVDSLAGLDHLEGKSVAILADGNVIDNGVEDDSHVVSGGSITLDRVASVVHVGLPIEADLETLNIDTPEGETLADKSKRVHNVTLLVESSRGVWVGTNPDNLTEYPQREYEEWGQPTALKTGEIEVNIDATWNNNGRIFVRQRDPLPLNILAVVPSGDIGG